MAAKLLVFTDLHVDIMHDAVARMEIICQAAKEQQVDFIVHLGDIMYPDAEFLRCHAPDSLIKRDETAWFVCDRDDEKVAILDMLKATQLKVYGVLGNHDMDSCDKKTACLYWDMPGPYYGFVEGGIRFLVLDGNFIQTDGKLIDFDHCNYKDYSRKATSFLPKAQLTWLEKEIFASPEPCVLLSHAPLGDELLNIHNMDEVWAIIQRTNADKRRVILAMNGHNHVDGVSMRQGVPFLSINSASNIWLGGEYAATRYSETMGRLYPHLPACAPYYDPLYAVITIDSTEISVQGTETTFVGKTPQALGFPAEKSYFPPCACIRSRTLSQGGIAPLTPT